MSQSIPEQLLYRIIFAQEEKIYEIYSRYLSEDSMVGFIDVEELVFTQEGTVVIDPSEEKLQAEFEGVRRIYIPLHHVLRIDEIVRKDSTKLKPHCTTGTTTQAAHPSTQQGNVHHLQTYRPLPTPVPITPSSSEGSEES